MSAGSLGKLDVADIINLARLPKWHAALLRPGNILAIFSIAHLPPAIAFAQTGLIGEGPVAIISDGAAGAVEFIVPRFAGKRLMSVVCSGGRVGTGVIPAPEPAGLVGLAGVVPMPFAA